MTVTYSCNVGLHDQCAGPRQWGGCSCLCHHTSEPDPDQTETTED